VLLRFERRLEGMVEGAFARVFKGVVEPVEVAAAIQKEAADKKAILGPGRILVPNDYTVELGSSDYARLSPYADPLGTELGVMLQERAVTQGWHFVGPVRWASLRTPSCARGCSRCPARCPPVPPARTVRPGPGRRCRPPAAGALPGCWSLLQPSRRVAVVRHRMPRWPTTPAAQRRRSSRWTDQ